VLSPDVLVVDIDPRHWINLVNLFKRDEERKKPSVLFLVVENETCLKAIHTIRGPLPGFSFPGMEHLEEIRRENDADVVAVVPSGFVGRAFRDWQEAMVRGEDWDLQIQGIVESLRPLVRKEIHWHPASPFSLPDPLPVKRLERLSRRFWPDGTCLGFFLFEGKRPYTSLILGKTGGKINLMTTLDAFGLAEGPLDWRTQAGAVADLCRERFGPLHAALWMELGCFREWRTGGKPLSFLHLSIKRGRAAMAPRPLRLRAGMFLARRLGRL